MGGGPERAVVRGPQKAGSLCRDAGAGVNIPVVPSREERCPAAGKGTAAAGTKSPERRSGIPGGAGAASPGGRNHGQGRGQTGSDGATSEAAVEANCEPNREPRLEERPGRVRECATHGPMKAWATSEAAADFPGNQYSGGRAKGFY